MKTNDKKVTKTPVKISPTTKKDETQGAEFPGYPHYASSDDIVHREKRVDVNLDDEVITNIKMGINSEAIKAEDDTLVEGVEDDFKRTSEFDVTKEDLEALGPKDLSLDMGDDEDLKHRVTPIDFSGKDLDVPGSELDDAQEKIGSEDEENNLYSQ